MAIVRQRRTKLKTIAPVIVVFNDGATGAVALVVVVVIVVAVVVVVGEVVVVA